MSFSTNLKTCIRLHQVPRKHADCKSDKYKNFQNGLNQILSEGKFHPGSIIEILQRDKNYTEVFKVEGAPQIAPEKRAKQMLKHYYPESENKKVISFLVDFFSYCSTFNQYEIAIKKLESMGYKVNENLLNDWITTTRGQEDIDKQKLNILFESKELSCHNLSNGSHEENTQEIEDLEPLSQPYSQSLQGSW